jgi:hypothetical protein
MWTKVECRTLLLLDTFTTEVEYRSSRANKETVPQADNITIK